MKDGEHEPEVGRDGRLLGEDLLDRPLDPVVADVDLVVEGDDLVAELHVLGLHRVDRAADGPQHHVALLLEARLERIEAGLVLEPRHHPKRPVT